MNYSYLDLVYVKENNTVQDAFAELKNTAKQADDLGFSRFWLAEHHNMEGVASNATTVLMGYVASQTSKIRVGSGGIMLPNHSPLIVAEQLGTLAQLYPNRIDLGLGRAPGTDAATAKQLNETFLKSVHEFPNNVAKLQNYFSQTNNHPSVRAYVAEGTEIPIYLLGSSTDSAVLAAKEGLPYAFAAHFAPHLLQDAFNLYSTNFKPKKSLQKPYKIACVNIIIGENEEDAKLQASSLYNMFLGLIRNVKTKLQAPNMQFYENWTFMEEAQINHMTAQSFIGDKETVARNLIDFINRYEIDEIMMSCPIFSMEKRLYSMEQFASIISKI